MATGRTVANLSLLTPSPLGYTPMQLDARMLELYAGWSKCLADNVVAATGTGPTPASATSASSKRDAARPQREHARLKLRTRDTKHTARAGRQ